MQLNVRLVRLPIGTRYAIQGMVLLSRRSEPGEYRLLQEIAKEGNLPQNFLSKIFQDLAKAGLLDSRRGRGGGYSLTRKAETIPLLEIVDAIQDHFSEQSHCLLRPAACTTNTPCILHDAVVQWEGLIRKRLEKTSLRDAVQEWKRA